MPGTPTPNLSLTLPTVGGDNNAWGTETNGNWTAVDNAITTAGVNNASVSTVLSFSPNFITFWRFTTGASTLTATLPTPSAANVGRILVIIKLDGAGGQVSIPGTIGGGSGYNLVNQDQAVWLMSNGVSWDIAINN